MPFRFPFLATATLAATFLASLYAPTVDAHAWIDCLDTNRSVVYDNAREWIYTGTRGQGLCAGYINDYVGRGDPKINEKMTHEINAVDVFKGASLCPAGPMDYTGWRHRQSVDVGEIVYFAYTDNGHTSRGSSGKDTTYGLYWTGQPGSSLTETTELSDDKLLDGEFHRFDDGNCGPKNEGRVGDGFPCVGQFTVPTTATPGIYNLVWFWKYYTGKVDATPTTGLQGSAFTSCFQLEVRGGSASNATESDVANEEDTADVVAPTTSPTTNEKDASTSTPGATNMENATVAPAPAAAGCKVRVL
jgi:hypothetical protein